MAADPKRRLIVALVGVQIALAAALGWAWLGRSDPAGGGASSASAAAADDMEEFGTEETDDPRPQKLPESYIHINKRKIVVEVADTARRREKGLMFRRKMADDRAMIFIFPQVRTDTGFWNENVPMGLDLVFADGEGKIVHLAQMKPRDRTTTGTKEPVRWVLEFPVGYVAKHKIKVGDKVEMPESLRAIKGE